MTLTVNELFDLEGKISVVTGASSGIGKATAERLAEFGAHVLLLDIDQDRGQDVAESIEIKGGSSKFIKCDVTSKLDCENVANIIQSDYGQIDVLFNNAGVIKRKSVVELEEDEWDLVIDVSLKGVYLLSKYLIPLMENNGGSIINTGSGWGLKGGDKAASYCAAKAGVVNLTKAMAIDHGHNNIRVNCIAPGDTDTPLLRSEAQQLKLDEQAFLQSSSERPLARLGTPKDIADGVVYLASALSSWVSGTVLLVDGGGLA